MELAMRHGVFLIVQREPRITQCNAAMQRSNATQQRNAAMQRSNATQQRSVTRNAPPRMITQP
jgi:hypothetical protein